MENSTLWHELLRTERERRSLTQEEVADKLGVSPRTVRSWESGTNQPSPKFRRELATLYNKSLEELGFVDEVKNNRSLDPPHRGNEARLEKLSSQPFSLNQHSAFLAKPVQEVPPHQPALPRVLKEEQIGTAREVGTRKYWHLHPHSVRLAIFAALLIGFSMVQWSFFTHVRNVSSQPPVQPTSSTTFTFATIPDATITSSSTQNCSGARDGVTLYIGSNYQGYCHTFAVNANGQRYNLAQSDFAQKVGSLRNPNGAYHVALTDQFERPEYFESDTAQLSSHWQGQAHWLRIDKYPPTSCNRGSDGIVAYAGSHYQGGCLFITQGILDVGKFNFDHTFSSLQFVGSYINSKKLVIYRQINYQDPCETYWQDQPDLGACGNLVASVLVLSFTHPTSTPTPTPTSTPTPTPIPTPTPESCPANSDGVTLYADSNYQGHCHTFTPGDYDLSQFGLDQNVSSLRDYHAAYHITLIDRSNRPGYFDQDKPVLPADWIDQAHTLRVEKHRSTSCAPGSDGITAYIDPNYGAGCLFITKDIPNLTPLNFDSVISSLRFVGSYKGTTQLVIYRKPNYQDQCGSYSQDQADLGSCSDQAVSAQVLP